MLKYFYLLIIFFISTASFAMFCPTSFNQIEMGDTLETVIKQCGNPNSQKTYQSENENGPQEWSFFANPQMKKYTALRTQAGQSATVKVLIAFNQGKVVNISTNGMSIATTGLCGSNVSIGDDMKSVKAACGEPMLVTKSDQKKDQSSEQKPNEITEFKYDATPPVTLIFENGKLRERQ